jgi:hypothetical protein
MVLLSGSSICQKRLRAAQLVALSGITAREFIERFFRAVECVTIMFLVDRLFVPRRHSDDRRFGKALAAASSFAFGSGGFSNRSRTANYPF